MFNSVDPDTVLVEVEDTGPVLRICGLGSPGVLPGDISAPEILSAGSSAAAPDAKSDMWAFGALLYRAHVGRCPVAVPGKPGVDINIDQCKGNDRLRSLLSSLLVKDPSKRPSAAAVMRHPYFLSSLVTDLQRTGALVEYDRKCSALTECVEATRDPAGKFRLRIRRSHVVEDVLKAFGSAAAVDLKKACSVTFAGEAGVDAGGLTSEMYELFFSGLADQALRQQQQQQSQRSQSQPEGKEEGGKDAATPALFEASNSTGAPTFLPRAPPTNKGQSKKAGGGGGAGVAGDSDTWNCERCTLTNDRDRSTCAVCHWANPHRPRDRKEKAKDPLVKYEAVGRVVVKMILDGRRCPISFSKAMLKHILGRPLSMEDLQAWDAQTAKSCFDILNSDVTLWGLDWDDVLDDSTAAAAAVAVEGGIEGKPLTQENKNELVTLKVQHVLANSRAGPLAALKKGFEAIPIAANLKLFSPDELAAVSESSHLLNNIANDAREMHA